MLDTIYICMYTYLLDIVVSFVRVFDSYLQSSPQMTLRLLLKEDNTIIWYQYEFITTYLS